MYDQNGANDAPEDEREGLDAWEETDSWRGEEHPDMSELDPYEGWPEDQCGPEYWLNKRREEE